MCYMALKLPRYFDLLMTYSSSVYCTNRLPSRTRKHLFLYPKLTDQVWESQEGWLKIIQFLIVRTIRWVGDRYIKRVISYLYTCYSPEVTIFRKSLFRIMMGKSSQQQEKIENASFTLDTNFANRKHPGKLSSLHLKSLYLFL